MDRFDRVTRSRVMSRNRSRGSKSTERLFRSMLMRAGISGWRLGHNSDLPGRPDVVFPEMQLAVFLDGCFWHGCRRCRSIPVTNRRFWRKKIRKNQSRDRRAVKLLRAIGWQSIRIWEHELRLNAAGALRRVVASLHQSPFPKIAVRPQKVHIRSEIDGKAQRTAFKAHSPVQCRVGSG
jgi:DNA mismatch endonuclease, patch repair protein